MSDIEMVIKLPEEVKVAITRMGLLRIPDEMQKIVDQAIQGGRALPSGYGTMYGTMSLLRAADEMRKTVDKGIQGEKALSSNKEIGTEEILDIIHKKGLEDEIFKALLEFEMQEEYKLMHNEDSAEDRGLEEPEEDGIER